MTKKVEYCYRHPNVVATHTCFLCENQICFNCKLETFGHIFCGAQCLTIYIAKRTIQSFFKLMKGMCQLLIWPFCQLKRIRPLAWGMLIVISGLIYGILFLWKLNRELKILQQKPSYKSSWFSVPDTIQIPSHAIFEPTQGGMVKSNRLDIIGEVEENHIVSLSIDGQLVRVELPSARKFVFKDIRLHRGQNHLVVRAVSVEGHATILQELNMMYSAPTLDHLMKALTRGPTYRKEVALTFDGGSLNNITSEILDILNEHDIQCTFFLTGEFIRKFPKTIKRIVKDGHEVGNHTWSHPKLTSFEENGTHKTLPHITADKLHEELEKTASLFKMVTGKEIARLWRAPYGYYNNEILRWASEAGYKHVGWTLGRGWEESMDTMDWVADKNSEAYHSASEISEKILSYAKNGKHGANGVIILMHLGSDRKDDFPHLKLPDIIQGLQKQGYGLVKVTQMDSEG